MYFFRSLPSRTCVDRTTHALQAELLRNEFMPTTEELEAIQERVDSGEKVAPLDMFLYKLSQVPMRAQGGCMSVMLITCIIGPTCQGQVGTHDECRDRDRNCRRNCASRRCSYCCFDILDILGEAQEAS